MLILTRNDGETIHIGDEITITVLGVNGMQIRLGIEAPESVSILRQELLERGEASLSKEQTPRSVHRKQVCVSSRRADSLDKSSPEDRPNPEEKRIQVVYKRRKRLEKGPPPSATRG